jgi:uncharacterized protein
MAVIIQYVVERNGKQMKIFTSKKDADSYDKMLDISEKMFDFITQADIKISDDDQDKLAIYLAENRDTAITLLKGISTKKTSKPKTQTEEKTQQNTETMTA